jgi:hypothetical protein
MKIPTIIIETSILIRGGDSHEKTFESHRSLYDDFFDSGFILCPGIQ